jgi:hypothetical protein
MACCLACILGPAVSPGRAGVSSSLADRAARFLYRDYIKNGMINADAGVGAYAFHILSQAALDLSAWVHGGISLQHAVTEAIKEDLARADKAQAKTLAQDLVAAQALGQNDLAAGLLQALKKRQTDGGFEDPGPLSIYSNMPAFELLGRAGLIGQIDTALAKSYILERQYLGTQDTDYGSWGSADGDQYYADFMTTAEAVRALHYLDPQKEDARIQEAVKKGLAWIRRQQRADGSFASGWDDPVVDTAEAVVTLKLLGIDPAAWRSSTGKSPVDYLISGASNADGSFGTSRNTMDATWVLWACLALEGETGRLLEPQTSAAGFRDMKGHWAENAVCRLVQTGIVSGFPDGTFRPENEVTRYETASMMVRLLAPGPASRSDLSLLGRSFKDAREIPGWAREAVAVALREGLVAGCPQPDGTLVFKGEEPVSRAELAAVIARIIEKKCGKVALQELDFADAGRIPVWARGAVGVACAKGVVGGYPDRTFRAEKRVTRAEAAVAFFRLAELLAKR